MDTVKTAQEIRNLAGSTIFSAQFVKKDGTIRDMLCRLEVKKGVKGVGLAYNPADYDLLTVFDVQKNGFRMLNLAILRKITVRGTTYDVQPSK